jgi:hypothetical protein
MSTAHSLIPCCVYLLLLIVPILCSQKTTLPVLFLFLFLLLLLLFLLFSLVRSVFLFHLLLCRISSATTISSIPAKLFKLVLTSF